MPDEPLDVDDLVRVLWEDPDGGVVVGTADGTGAVAAIARGPSGFVRLIAVHPSARRRGLGRELLAHAAAWLRAQGATDVYVGGEAPFYLWPGVDTRWPDALSFFEAAGFGRIGAEMNMTCPATHLASAPEGVQIERATTTAPVLAFVGAHWPNWIAEADRAVALGTCFVAVDDTGVVGFIGHSVNRRGWLGPMGTHPERQHAGVGTALVAAVCADARVAGRDIVEIAWVGPVGFYVKAVGAEVARTFIRMRSRSSR